MDNIVFMCIKCGQVKIMPPDSIPSRQNKCPKCNIGFLRAALNHQPDITENQYNEMISNNTWNDYLINNLITFPYVRNLKQQIETQQNSNGLAPKCPTCGTTNIRRITGTERVVNAGLFGLFGNTRKYQFECENPLCKYKW